MRFKRKRYGFSKSRGKRSRRRSKPIRNYYVSRGGIRL